jgi:hypothetical protein
MSPADARKLIDLAAQGGADAAWLRRVAGDLIEQGLELALLRRCVDSRKRETLRLAAEISKANRALLAARAPDRVASLCVRFNLGRSQIYELIKKSGEISDTATGAVPSAHRSTA